MSISSQIKQGHNYEDMFVRALSRVINLYSDRSHFIHELMQNAEDVKATRMKFELYEDRLEVSHDGKPFTRENLIGLCDVGLSDKTENEDQIGQFGIGFKAVFGICDVVRLYSNASNWQGEYFENLGDFSIEIQNFINPVDIENIKLEKPYTTRFVFPFAVGKEYHSFESREELALFLDDRLNSFDSSSLLFMKNLVSLTYVSHIGNKVTEHVYQLEHKSILGQFEELYTGKANDDVHYLKFSKKIRNDSRNVDIAFCFRYDGNGNRIFIAPPTPYLFIYFPTVTYSHLNFIVQGPYHTTPNRSTLPEDDSTNDMLVQETVELFYRSILILRDIGYLNLQLLSMLPITPPSELFDMDSGKYRKKWLFAPVQEKMIEMLQKEALIPCRRIGYFSSLNQAVIIRNQKLFSIFDDDCISLLLKTENMNIVSSDLMKDDNSTLYEALRKLKIRIIELNSLPKLIDANPVFMKERDRDWLVDFYNILADYPSLLKNQGAVGNFCNTRIILNNKGTFSCPKKGCVFNPSDVQDEKYLFVDADLYEECPDFFKILDLGNPDIVDSFLDDLEMKYRNSSSISLEDNANDWKTLIDLADKYDLSAKQREQISEMALLYIHKPGNGEFSFMSSKYKALYDTDGKTSRYDSYYFFPTITKENVDTEQFFAGVPYIGIIDFESYLQYGADLETFNDKYRIYYIKYSIVGRCYKDWHYNDLFSCNTKVCEIAPFKMDLSVWAAFRVIKSIVDNAYTSDSRYKSAVLMRLLQQNAESIHGSYYERVSNPTVRESDCALLKLLDSVSWVYTEDDELVKPSDIYPEELSSSLYGNNHDDPEFYRILGFKESNAAAVESFIDEFLADGNEEKQSILVDRVLKKHFGLTTEQLKRKLDIADSVESTSNGVFDTENSLFGEFPSRPVKNPERLKSYDIKYFENARPVQYKPRMINQRISLKSVDNKAYVEDMYQYGHTGFYACQMCQKPTRYVTAVEIIRNPVKELAPMHLCLCPECARMYLHYRDSGKGVKLESFMEGVVSSPSDSDNVDIAINGDTSITFTSMHLAEVQELLKCMNVYKDISLPEEICSSESITEVVSAEPVIDESADNVKVQEDIPASQNIVMENKVSDDFISALYKREEDRDVQIIKKLKLYDDDDREQISNTYVYLKDHISRPPTRVELFKYGVEHGECYYLDDYISLLADNGDCNDDLLSRMERKFIEYVEALDMSRSYKIPVLLAFCRQDRIKPYITEEDLFKSCQSFYAVDERREDLILPNHISYDEATSKTYRQWAMKNPIKFLSSSKNSWFTRNGEGLLSFRSFLFPYLNNPVFASHVYDALMYRYELYKFNRNGNT